MEVKEVQIDVPWGHIAVKIWGDEKNSPVLAVHGVLDNAGAFDRLVALLPDSFCYYCIDLPGHGQSTHWPPHTVIHTLDNLLALRAVVDHFEKPQYTFMGHSWGAQSAIIFAQLYPERVSKLIMLDAIYTFPVPAAHFGKHLRFSHDGYFEMMRKLAQSKGPEYSYEEMLDKLMNQRRYGSINQAAAEALIKRNMVKTEKGNLRFASDPRIKHVLNPTYDLRYMADVWKKHPIRCPVLFVIASESVALLEYYKVIVSLAKKQRNFKFVQVEGNHDVHNAHPERVAPLVTQFLLKQHKQKL